MHHHSGYTNAPARWLYKCTSTVAIQMHQHSGYTNAPARWLHKCTITVAIQMHHHSGYTNAPARWLYKCTITVAMQMHQHGGCANSPWQWWSLCEGYSEFTSLLLVSCVLNKCVSSVEIPLPSIPSICLSYSCENVFFCFFFVVHLFVTICHRLSVGHGKLFQDNLV